MSKTHVIAMITIVLFYGASAVAAEEQGRASRDEQSLGSERVVSEPTGNHLPGNRMVQGRIKDVRSNQIEVDVGNVQPLFIPLKPAQLKGQTFKAGDEIIVTLNDHNAIVDYHHPGEHSDHQVFRGHLTTPLTVGLDKAVIKTEQGTKTFKVAERARGKLTAMPVGPELLFMADETGMLVDAQLASVEAVRESGDNNKARIKGAHQQLRGIFQGKAGEGRLKFEEEGRTREIPYREPLGKLDRLKRGQDVVLLMDDQGYVLEIATTDVPPSTR